MIIYGIYIYINHLGSWFTIMAIARGNTDIFESL
jgi:hypothetical protein